MGVKFTFYAQPYGWPGKRPLPTCDFLLGWNLTEKMKRQMGGFLQRTEGNKANLVGLGTSSSSSVLLPRLPGRRPAPSTRSQGQHDRSPLRNGDHRSPPRNLCEAIAGCRQSHPLSVRRRAVRGRRPSRRRVSVTSAGARPGPRLSRSKNPCEFAATHRTR
jgi:hypothetical protein